MSFTPNRTEKSKGFGKRLQNYLNLREQFNKYGGIPQVKGLGVRDKVFCLLLLKGEKYVASKTNLRELQAEIIHDYLTKFIDPEKYLNNRAMIYLTLKLESSVGRSIRKIREDDAMNFHAETYHGASPKYEENRESGGEEAMESATEL